MVKLSLPSFPKLSSINLSAVMSTSAVKTGKGADSAEALARAGVPVKYEIDPITGKGVLKVGKRGMALTDDALKNLSDFLKNNLDDTEFDAMIKTSDTNLPSPTVKKDLQLKSTSGAQTVRNTITQGGASVATQMARWADVVGKSKYAKTGLKVAGVSLLGYFAWDTLQDMATQQNGCWLYNLETDANVYKVSNESDPLKCRCASNTIKTGTEALVAQACVNQCVAANPTTSGGVLWSSCTDICGCATNTVPPTLLPDAQQFGIRTVKKDMFDVLSDVMAEFGGFIGGIAEGALDIVFDTLGGIVGGIGNVLMYVGIAVGVAALIALSIYLGIKQPWKKKAALEGGGCASNSKSSSLWGGGSVFY